MTTSSEEGFPELPKAVDEIWLEQARAALRDSIQENLVLIASGHFSEEELSFALATAELPSVEVPNPEMDAIMESEDNTDAWNSYIAEHPEFIEQMEVEDSLKRARQAATDKQAVEAHMNAGLTFDDAIEAVIAERPEEIEFHVVFMRAALKAAADNGFPIL